MLVSLVFHVQMRWTLEFSGGPVGPGVFGERSQNLHVIQGDWSVSDHVMVM